jgi:hypothetical protein
MGAVAEAFGINGEKDIRHQCLNETWDALRVQRTMHDNCFPNR